MNLLLSFIVQLFSKALKYSARRVTTYVILLSRLSLYLSVNFIFYITLVYTANTVISYLAAIKMPDAVIVAFSYLPTNIGTCLTLLFNIEFICFIYIYRARVYKVVNDMWRDIARSGS